MKAAAAIDGLSGEWGELTRAQHIQEHTITIVQQNHSQFPSLLMSFPFPPLFGTHPWIGHAKHAPSTCAFYEAKGNCQAKKTHTDEYISCFGNPPVPSPFPITSAFLLPPF